MTSYGEDLSREPQRDRAGTCARVTLTPIECRVAIAVGTERRLRVLLANGHDRPGIKPESVWTIDIEGAAAEMAFAKHMSWYWDGSVGTFHDYADVRHVHVRRQVQHHWDMCVRPGDAPGVYVLVTGMLPNYQIHGWANWPDTESYEAQFDPNREPARYVRQSSLRDLIMLPAE